MRWKRFSFIEPGPMVDGELRLVEPTEDLLDAHLEYRLTRNLISPEEAREERAKFLVWAKASPRGRTPGNRSGRVPQYTFWLNTPEFPRAGYIVLRVGRTRHIRLYAGHVGYRVDAFARGRHYASRACKLIYPLAKAHGLDEIWITCAPNNAASMRTAELAGGVYVNTVDTPPTYFEVPRRARYRVAL